MLPVGGFLVLHLWTNTAALGGASSYTAAVEDIQRLPGLAALEIFGIYLPLAFHALYGVRLIFASRSNLDHYPYNRNYLYILQRVSGLVAFVFIAYHLWEFRIQKYLGHMQPGAFFDTLVAHLSRVQNASIGVFVPSVPWLAIFYAVGILACVFHFSNGIVTFVISWGVVGTRRALRWVNWVAALGGTALFAMGYATLLYLATGAHLPLDVRANSAQPCPAPSAQPTVNSATSPTKSE